jgi:hypothetical protein
VKKKPGFDGVSAHRFPDFLILTSSFCLDHFLDQIGAGPLVALEYLSHPAARIHDHGAKIVADAAVFRPKILAELIGQLADPDRVAGEKTPVGGIVMGAFGVTEQALRRVVFGIE